MNDIWLTCTHIPGVQNREADQASRKFNDNLEWKLDENISHQTCERFGKPDIDLFASRKNTQLEKICIMEG